MIRITRVKHLADSAVYEIYIDDVYRGYIEGGDTMDFEVENGRHTVYAKVGRSGSKELCVDVNDSVVELELDCIMSGLELYMSPLKAISYNSSRKDEYLILQVKDPDAEEEIAAIDRFLKWLQGIRLPRFWKSKKSDEGEE